MGYNYRKEQVLVCCCLLRVFSINKRHLRLSGVLMSVSVSLCGGTYSHQGWLTRDDCGLPHTVSAALL